MLWPKISINNHWKSWKVLCRRNYKISHVPSCKQVNKMRLILSSEVIFFYHSPWLWHNAALNIGHYSITTVHDSITSEQINLGKKERNEDILLNYVMFPWKRYTRHKTRENKLGRWRETHFLAEVENSATRRYMTRVEKFAINLISCCFRKASMIYRRFAQKDFMEVLIAFQYFVMNDITQLPGNVHV